MIWVVFVISFVSTDFNIYISLCSFNLKHLDGSNSGLLYIHELNIVHLDIKPYNILFSEKVIIIELFPQKHRLTPGIYDGDLLLLIIDLRLRPQDN